MRPAKNVSRIVLALSGVLALLGLTAVAQAAVGKATFTVTGSPNSLTVQQGKGGTYQVSVNSVNGFVGDVSLALSGLPTGATATTAKVSLSAGSTQVAPLTVTVSRSTPLGKSTLTLSGTSGRTVVTNSAALVVEKVPGSISIVPSPTTYTATPGGSAVYSLTISKSGGANDTSTELSATGLPTGFAAAQFSPNPALGTSATMTITVPASATAGSYSITIKGTAGLAKEYSGTATVTLVVDANQPGKPFSIALGSSVSGLAPGVRPQALPLVLSNPNNQTIDVTNLTVAASRPAGSACGSDNYAVAQYSGTYPVRLPGGASNVPLTELLQADGTKVHAAKLPTLTMLNLDRNQDACKGQTVTLTFTGTAQGN